MQLSEEHIKQAILHPELPIRRLALDYFSKSFSQDVTIMPLVIEAVKSLPINESIHFVAQAANLPQTESTIQWCMEELRRDLSDRNERVEDYQYALSKLLANADLSLTVSKESEILELPFFQIGGCTLFTERIKLLSEGTESLWDRLTDFCEDENDKSHISDMDIPHAYRLIEALARGGSDVAEKVLGMLNEKIDYSDNTPRSLMQGFVIRLAGELRLTAAVPLLVEAFKEDADWYSEECTRALIKIGGSELAEILLIEFSTAEWSFRMCACDIFRHLHVEPIVQKCVELFENEDNEEIKTFLGKAALNQFSSDVIEPVRQFIRSCKINTHSCEVNPEIFGLRECLVSVSTLFDIDIPEREEWDMEFEQTRLFNEQQIAKLKKQILEQQAEIDLLELQRDKYKTTIQNLEDEIYHESDDELIEPTYSPDTIVRQDTKIGRNDPCPCGSGKKYKKCCLSKANENRLFN